MKRILKINISKFVVCLGIIACTSLSSCSQQEGRYGKANQEFGRKVKTQTTDRAGKRKDKKRRVVVEGRVQNVRLTRALAEVKKAEGIAGELAMQAEKAIIKANEALRLAQTLVGQSGRAEEAANVSKELLMESEKAVIKAKKAVQAAQAAANIVARKIKKLEDKEIEEEIEKTNAIIALAKQLE